MTPSFSRAAFHRPDGVHRPQTQPFNQTIMPHTTNTAVLESAASIPPRGVLITRTASAAEVPSTNGQAKAKPRSSQGGNSRWIPPTIGPSIVPSAVTIVRQTESFSPSDEAFVVRQYPATNYSGQGLEAQGLRPIRSYLKFQVTGLTGEVVRATVGLVPEQASEYGFSVYAAPSSSWKSSSPMLGTPADERRTNAALAMIDAPSHRRSQTGAPAR